MDGFGIKEAALVFMAGGLGATARVLLQAWVDAAWAERLAHVGTLSANLLGCLAIGFLAVALVSPLWRWVVLGGFLGGFTTYSAFALFSVGLVESGRWGTLSVQLALHLVGGMAAVWIGAKLARALELGPPST